MNLNSYFHADIRIVCQDRSADSCQLGSYAETVNTQASVGVHGTDLSPILWPQFGELGKSDTTYWDSPF